MGYGSNGALTVSKKLQSINWEGTTSFSFVLSGEIVNKTI